MEVKGRTLYSVWLVMKLIHGSLHRVIELPPLGRKLISLTYSFDSCFAARNCCLQSLHTIRIFAVVGAKVSHLGLTSAESACVDLTNLRVGWGPLAPAGTSCWLLDLEPAGSAYAPLRPLGHPCPGRCFSGEWLFFSPGRQESLCKVCACSPHFRDAFTSIRVLLRAT